MQRLIGFALVTVALATSCGPSQTVSQVLTNAPAVDAALGTVGPWTVFEQDYHLPAKEDPLIIVGRQTEMWARLYLPQQPEAFANGPAPVLVFLHGNHPTCGTGGTAATANGPAATARLDNNSDYSMTGVCPENYEVVPNHRGYDYLARNMASWGYAVISINANRGITAAPGILGDSGLNLTRGRLVLSHLALLAKWNNDGGSLADAGVDLQGKLDLDQVGLMGHSRGGEGVRAAYNLYSDPGSPWPAQIGPMSVRGIFEIGPVDGQTSRTLNAMNTAWNVLIPLCDGDVSDLQGVHPFDRMLKNTSEASQYPKSTFVVWGANHNFFNTEWQSSDAFACDDHLPIFDRKATGSDKQRLIGLVGLSSFFRSHVGKQATPAFGHMFDPAFDVPGLVAGITPYGRDFVLTPDQSKTVHLVEFTGVAANSPVTGASKVATQVQLLRFHDQRQGLSVSWTDPAPDSSITLRTAAADLSALATLDLSLESLELGHGVDFDVRLVAADGSESASLALSQVRTVEGAVGRDLLQTVRMPLASFTGIDLTKVASVKLLFDKMANGHIIVGAVRASAASELAPRNISLSNGVVSGTPGSGPQAFVGRGAVVDIRLDQGAGAHGPGSQPPQALVNLTVQSDDQFPVRDQLPILRVGSRSYDLAGYGDHGIDTLVFQVPAQEFKTFRVGDHVVVSYGAMATSTYIINAGSLSGDILEGIQ